MNAQAQLQVAKNSSFDCKQLKVQILDSNERSITIQIGGDVECEALTQFFREDSQTLLVDIPLLLMTHSVTADSNFEAIKTPINAAFLKKVDSTISSFKSGPNLNRLRHYLSKHLTQNQNIELIVLLNPSKGFPDFYQLIVDVEQYLPQVRVVVLDESIWAVTDWTWHVNKRGKIEKWQNVVEI